MSKINLKKFKEIIKKEKQGFGNFKDIEDLKKYTDFFLSEFTNFKKEQIIWFYENQDELKKIYNYKNIDVIIFYLKHFYEK